MFWVLEMTLVSINEKKNLQKISGSFDLFIEVRSF